LPIFRSDEAPDTARDPKTFPNPERRTPEQRKRIKGKRQELRRKRQELRKIRNEVFAADDLAEKVEHKRRKERAQQEVFRLERDLRAIEEGRVEDEREAGALPDFLIIGAQKSGTTFLYNLLSKHPLVEPAAKKELHFFDHRFDFGVEWYRRCFPAPRWEGGRRTITGEASPYYLFHPRAAGRVAQVVPEARLIVLLRNPVDRAYSHHQQLVRKGGEPLGFEEAIEAEEERLRGERNRLLEDEHYASFEHQRLSYLSWGVYIDQLLRWTGFFDREQLLVLKSEDFFEKPKQTLKVVLQYLELPEWEPGEEVLEGGKRNEGNYDQEMDPSTRRRLEEYFAPHNRRLYDFLGVDFGW
jgi:hypothetical protein